MPVSFSARIQDAAPAWFVEVPNELVATFGAGKRPPLKVTCHGVQTRTRVAVYGGRSIIGFTRAVREEMGLQAGETVELMLELDDQPRAVELPSDFAAALSADPVAEAAFARLSFTNQKEYVEWLSGAKRAETRQRRLAQAPELLKAGRKTPL